MNQKHGLHSSRKCRKEHVAERLAEGGLQMTPTVKPSDLNTFPLTHIKTVLVFE
jgi:uracil-DNA glycosylase